VNFVVVGLSHKTAPVEIREQAYIPASGVGECLRRLADRELIESGVLLSTCNRTELYALAPLQNRADELLQAFGLWPHELPYSAWQRYAYQLEGRAAIGHLFRVAAGMESMIIGEGQVLGQLKDALSQARQAGVTDARLDVVLHGAIRAGKRVRHETPLGREPVSVSHAAVVKAGKLLGSLEGRGVLLLGAGPMSEIALRLLQNDRIGPVFVASRTRERAERMARPSGAESVAMDDLERIADRIDIVMSSSSAPHHLLDRERVERMQAKRSGRMLLLIDMAVPRDIDPAAAAVTGVQLADIDDLQSIAEHGREARKAWLPAAETIIEEELTRTERALEARDAAAAIATLVSRAERLRDEVVERHMARHPASSEAEQAAMRQLADSLTSRLLHEPIQALRETADGSIERAVITQAFGLDRDHAKD
jgi:glutamyl-tRNA reductase